MSGPVTPPPEIIVLDLEAYAPLSQLKNPTRKFHRIWEFAAQSLGGGFKFARVLHVADAHNPKYRLQGAQKRGIDLTDPNLPKFRQVWDEFTEELANFLGTKDYPIIYVAHGGLEHDFRVLLAQFQTGIPQLRVLDSLTLLTEAFPNAPRHSVDALYANFFNKRRPQAHEAADDASALGQLMSGYVFRYFDDYAQFAYDCQARSRLITNLENEEGKKTSLKSLDKRAWEKCPLTKCQKPCRRITQKHCKQCGKELHLFHNLGNGSHMYRCGITGHLGIGTKTRENQSISRK